jgi:hypothetical protein
MQAFVYLLDEGTDCWRPVELVQIDTNTFQVVGPMPDDEEWEFPPGALVKVRDKTFSSGFAGKVVISVDA